LPSRIRAIPAKPIPVKVSPARNSPAYFHVAKGLVSWMAAMNKPVAAIKSDRIRSWFGFP
jgi:hypothetical protein